MAAHKAAIPAVSIHRRTLEDSGQGTCMSGNAIPPGTIRIDAGGVWFYDGIQMARRDIIRLFYCHLLEDGAGGWFIQIGQQRYPVEVEDTPFVVCALTWTETQKGQGEAAHLQLSDDSVEELDPHTLRMRQDGVPCCRVKNGTFEARLSRPSYYTLAERIEYDSVTDAYALHINGRTYPIS